jgi:hypothetical protein
MIQEHAAAAALCSLLAAALGLSLYVPTGSHQKVNNYPALFKIFCSDQQPNSSVDMHRDSGAPLVCVQVGSRFGSSQLASGKSQPDQPIP